MGGDDAALIAVLEKKGALRPCARCGESSFVLNKAEMNLLTNNASGVFDLSKYIPCVAVICKNCGAISLHAISVLTDTEKYSEE